MSAEARLISWLSVAVGVACAFPVVRDLWREEKVRRASLLEQQRTLAAIPEQRLPDDFMRDIADIARGGVL